MEGDAGGTAPAGRPTGGSVPPSGSVPDSGRDPIGGGPGRQLVYDGRLGALYRIFLVNLLLAIVTLGIYRFWGKTRIRRYLWSRLSYDGDRFEYTGTGGELFRGFLVVAAVLVVVGIFLGGLNPLLLIIFSDDPLKAELIGLGATYILYIVLAYLLMVGRYTALRYRLSRSRWRGIRGALAGSPWKYGIAAFAWMLAVGASLGFAKPVADVSLARMRLRHVFFGTAQAQLRPDSGTTGLYGPYVASWFATLIGFVAVYAVPFTVIALNRHRIAPYFDDSDDPAGGLERMIGDPAAWAIITEMVVATVVIGVLIWAAILFVRSWYTGVLLDRLAAMSEIAGLRPRPTYTTAQLWRLLAGNLVIAVFTLGLGTPIVLHRTWRFLAERLHVVGTLDGAAIGQSQQAMPGRGEGLLDALDTGGAF